MNIFLPILPELSIFIAAISLLVLGLFIDNINVKNKVNEIMIH